MREVGTPAAELIRLRWPEPLIKNPYTTNTENKGRNKREIERVTEFPFIHY